MRDAGITDLVAEQEPGKVVYRVALLERLASSGRVTMVSAPPGSGKTVLLRSWISQARLAGRVAWVTAGRDESDPQQFWLSVLGGLQRTAAGSGLVRPVSAAPGLDGWVLAEPAAERSGAADGTPLAGGR